MTVDRGGLSFCRPLIFVNIELQYNLPHNILFSKKIQVLDQRIFSAIFHCFIKNFQTMKILFYKKIHLPDKLLKSTFLGFLLVFLLGTQAIAGNSFSQKMLTKAKAKVGLSLLQNRAIDAVQAQQMSVVLASFEVTNLNDAGTGSLRQAMLDAIALGNGPHEITFAAGLNGTIDLASNLPTITVQGITVDGDSRITINGNGNNVSRRIFYGTANSSGTTIKNIDIKNTGLEPFRFDGTALTNLTFENINAYQDVDNWFDYAIYIGGNINGLTVKNYDFKNRQNVGNGAIHVTGTTNNVSIDNFDISEGAAGASHGLRFGGVANDITIRNCDIDLTADGSTNDADYGIYFNTTSTNVTIDNCTFLNNEVYAIYTANTATNWKITNSTFDNEEGYTANQMIRFQHFVDTLLIENCLIDCDFAGSTDDGSYGIWFQQAITEVTIKGVTIHDADEDAIGINTTTTNMLIDSCFFDAKSSSLSGNNDGVEFYNNAARTNIEISRCVFDSLGRAGLIFQTTNATTEFNVHDNIIRNVQKTQGYGMWLSGSGGVKDIVIKENEIYDNFGSGIYIERADNVHITQNSIYNNGAHGINLLANDGNCDYQNIDGDTPNITNSVETATNTYNVTMMMPAYCATGNNCTVEIFINDQCDDTQEGRQYVQTFTGLSSGSQTVSVNCPSGECLDVIKGFWTATITAEGCSSTLNTSEFSSGFPLISKAPGGVAGGLDFWLKADAGTQTNVSNNFITTGGFAWEDQSGGGHHLDAVTGDPQLMPAEMNFNPVVDFDGGDYFNINNVANRYFWQDYTAGEAFTTVLETSTATSVGNPFYLGGNINGYYTLSTNILYEGFGATDRKALNLNLDSYITEGDGVEGGTTVIDTERPNIYGVHSATNDWAMHLNGKARYIDNTNTVNFSVGSTTHIGARPSAIFNGKVGEYIMYDRKLTDVERQKVNSYLALKYGISMDQETPLDYLNSAGTVIWDATANAAYATDINGIGYDDASDLMQRQATTKYKLRVLSVFHGDQSGGLPTSNKSNSDDIATDQSFMMWGHNAGLEKPIVAYTPTAITPTNPFQRLERVWKIQETGTIGTVTLQGPDNAELLLVSSSNDFSSGVTEVTASTTPEGETVFVTDLSDGDYFTFAREVVTPSACSNGLAFVHGSDDNGTSGLGISAWVSNGDGTFSTKEIVFSGFDRDASGTEVFGHDAASNSFFEDIDNDGDLDIIHVTENNSNSIYCYLNNGDNTFASSPVSTTGMEAGTNSIFAGLTTGEQSWLGDTDADGNLDYIFSGNDGIIHVWKGNGDGTFATTKISTTLLGWTGYRTSGVSAHEYFIIADVNGDNSVDLIGSTYDAGSTRIQTWFGNGDGTFVENVLINDALVDVGGSNGSGVGNEEYSQFADVDSDGDLDYLHAEAFNSTYQIWTWLNDGTGTYDVTPICSDFVNLPSGGYTRFANYTAAEWSYFIDVTGDGFVDYITTADNVAEDNGITVYPGRGDGQFDDTPIKTAIPNFATGISNLQTTFMGCGFVNNPEVCDDGIDNDGDGFIDENDEDCITDYCNGGNFVQWTGYTANGACGSLTDLDGNVLNVDVTGSVVNILNGASYVNTAGTFTPQTTQQILQIDNADEPQMAGTGPFYYKYDFSKPVSGLIAHLYSMGSASADLEYTFKDANGAAIGVEIISTDDDTEFYQTAGNILRGKAGNGTIQFDGDITHITVEVRYITGQNVSSWTGITFGVACPVPVFDVCASPSIVDWVSRTAGEAVGTVDVADSDGNTTTVDVTLTGSNTAAGNAGAFNNVNQYNINTPTGEDVRIDNAAEPQVTSSGPFYYVWDFSQGLKNPIFNIRSLGSASQRVQYTFTNEDDQPLKFFVRMTDSYEKFRQTGDNILEGLEGNGTIQFEGTPEQIKMKVYHLTGSTIENNTIIQLIASCPAPEPEDGAGKCNGANFAKWISKTPNSVVGQIVDPTGVGSSITGSGSMINIGYSGYFNNANRYELPSRWADRVAIDNADEPQTAGTGPFEYQWVISNPIEDLLMYWFSVGRWHQQIEYTFTDDDGNPIPVEVVSTDNATNFYVTDGNKLVGREGHGVIRFKVPVTTINMEVNHLTGGGGREYWTGLTFAKMCDEPEAIQECTDPKFTDWTSNTASTADGTITLANGDVVDVDVTGSMINSGYPGQFRNTDYWDPVDITSERLAIDNAAEPQLTGTGPFIYNYDFSQPIQDPIMNFYSVGRYYTQLKYTFKDANGDPFPFCVRKTNNWENFHQVFENVLIGREGHGSIQFTGITDKITMEVEYLTGQTREYYTSVQVVGGCKTAPICSNISTFTCSDGDPIDLTAYLPAFSTGGTWEDEDNSGANISDPTSVDLTSAADGTYNFRYLNAAEDSCHRVQVEKLGIIPGPTIDDILICEGGSTEIITPTPADRQTVLYDEQFIGDNGYFIFRSKCGSDSPSSCYINDLDDLSNRGLTFEIDSTDFSKFDRWWYTWMIDRHNLKYGRLKDEMVSVLTDSYTLLPGETALFSGQSARWWGWMNDDDYVKFAYVIDGVETEFADRRGAISGRLTTSQGSYTNNTNAAQTIQMRVKVKNSWNEGHYLDNFKIVKFLAPPTYTYYDDAGLTDVLGTGLTYNPETEAGSTDSIYVTCTQNGCESNATLVEVEVSPNNVEPMAGEPVFYCAGGGNVDLTANITNYQAGGTWEDTDNSGLTITDPTDVDISGLADGSYNFTYTLDGTAPCLGESAVVTVNIGMAPGAPEIEDITVCEGGSTEIIVPDDPDREEVLYEQTFEGKNSVYVRSKCTGADPSTCYQEQFDLLATDRGLNLDPGTDFSAWKYWVHTWIWDYGNLKFARMLDQEVSLSTDVMTLLPGETATFSGQSARWWGWMNDDDYVKFSYLINGAETEFADRRGLISGALSTSQATYKNEGTTPVNIQLRVKVKNSWNEAHYIDNLKVTKTLNKPTYNFYSDGDLTTMVGSGSSYDPETEAGDTDVVYVTCINNGCETVADTVNVSVSPNSVEPMEGEPVFYCPGGSNVDLTESISNFQSGGTWTDDHNTNVTIGDGTDVDVSGLADGSYIFTYTVAGTAPCLGESAVVTVNIGLVPGAPEIEDITVCEGGSTEIIVPDDPNKEEVLYEQAFEGQNSVYFRSKCTGADANTCHTDNFNLLATNRGLNLDAGTDFSAMKWWWHSWIWDYGNLKFARLQNEQISLSTDVMTLLPGEVATFSGQSARWWGWMNDDDYVKFAYIVNGVETEFADRRGLISSALSTSQATYENTSNVPVNIQLRVKVKNSWNEAHYIDNLKVTKTLNKPVYNFYTDGNLTNMVASGSSYDPETAAGATDVVYVTCINNGCETVADTVMVSVTENDVTPFTSTTAYFCTGGSDVDLTAQITDFVAGGTWTDDENTGVTIGDGTSVDVSGLADGFYNFTYALSGTAPCPGESVIVTVSIGNDIGEPELSATSAANTCPVEGINIDTLVVNGQGDEDLIWSTDNNPSDGLSDTIADPTNIKVSGAYYAYYTANGCYSAPSHAVNVTATNCSDTDGDGIIDDDDDDDDNDGIADVDETGDTDNDGIPDSLESNTIDTDGDGNEDYNDSNADGDVAGNDGTGGEQDGVLEGPWKDVDNDGIPDHLDADTDGSNGGSGDSDNDGLSDAYECPDGFICPDNDGDGIPDYMDTDSDNDGITDEDECPSGNCTDTDNDGIADNIESNTQDTDGDGNPDYNDSDADGDSAGTDDNDDGGAGNGLDDDDNDGIPNYLDADNGDGSGDDVAGSGDSDNDGISDATECPDGVQCPDSDGDGIPDYMDEDSDNDGIADEDECPSGTCGDTDNDGIADNIESNTQDTDGDGNPDYDDADADGDSAGTDDNDDGGAGNGLEDDDNDGIPNYLDADNGDGSGGDIAGSGDSDNDGLSDTVECPDGVTCPDSDGDGIPDYMDEDSDGDGIADEDECPSGTCGDTDGDGIADNIESNTQDTDGDGNPDYDDADADGDSAGTDDNDDGGTGNGLDDDDNDGIPNYLDADNGSGTGDDIAGSGDSDGDGISDATECPDGVTCPDSDNDGTPDYMESNVDSDGDGISDTNDPDDDNDGIADVDETGDTDGDGIPDSLESNELDTDGDGMADYDDNNADGEGATDGTGGEENGVLTGPWNDTDGDGIPDHLDADNGSGTGTDIAGTGDSDNDGLSDAEECPDGFICPDSDGDGIPDYMDTDSDNDGTADEDECPTGAPCADTDNDGIADNIESNTIDTDGDGEPDYNDSDADGDSAGTDDNDDGGTGNGTDDDDNDGIPNYLDADNGSGTGTDVAGCGDSDNDGLSDCEECPDGIICPDSDNDGTPDYMESNVDSDGDGIADVDDSDDDNDGIADTDETGDTDNDGIPDSLEANDLDTDGDGMADYNDANADGEGQNDGTGGEEDGVLLGPWNDTDNDGIPDHLDADNGSGTGDDVVGSGDGDNDGLSDAEECPDGYKCPDSDGDGIPDYMDTDSDNDGLSDEDECPTGAPCTDTDGDGIADNIESNTQDTDGDGNPDYDDTNADGDAPVTDDSDDGGNGNGTDDDDNDGIPNYLDADNGSGTGTDVAGCGDSDNDGLSDCEECPDGVQCPDSDGDNIPDYMDTDSDNDGIADEDECPTGAPCADTDNDGIADNIESNTQDTDGDGNPDYNDSNADGDAPDTNDSDDEGTGNGLADEDGDGIPNYLDADNGNGSGTGIAGCGDSDNDGLSDCEECPDGVQCPDSDGDNIPDYMDTDSDNDGIADEDECPTGAPCADTDNDGIADNIESNTQDTDGDGNPDYDDADADGDSAGTDDSDDEGAGNGLEDADGDGIPNYLDADNGNGNDGTIAGSGDSDGDGLSDAQECPDGVQCPDTDGDNIPDYMDDDSDNDGLSDEDECPNGICLDTDNDGITDNIESNVQDTDMDGNPDYNDTDADGDSPNDDDSDDGGAEQGLADDDRDGIPNYLDADNGDGSNGTIAGSGDSDNDGLSDSQECPDGVQCPDSDGNGTPDYMQPRIQLSIKAMLGGAYDMTSGLMRDDLRAQNQIPLAQPYGEWIDFDYDGNETTSLVAFAVSGNNAIVDWVMVELRSANDPSTVRARRAGLIQRDGDIVDTDGISPLYFTDATPGDYYVAVRHRNHFGAMTENPVTVSTSATVVDFTADSMTTYQKPGVTGSEHARQEMNDGKMVLWPGNYSEVNGSGNQIIFQGINSDTDAVFFKVLNDVGNTNFFPLYIVSPTYSREDGDMNGQVIFQGAGADQDVIFFSTALFPENTLTTPIYILYEQMPD
jgi:hypothetical protein